MKQQSFSDYEYSCRKKKTKREKFLDTMEEIIPWDEWVEFVRPYYPSGKRGRPVKGIEKICCKIIILRRELVFRKDLSVSFRRFLVYLSVNDVDCPLRPFRNIEIMRYHHDSRRDQLPSCPRRWGI